MRQDVNRRLQCHPICCRNNQETIRLSSDHHYFADALLFGIFSSFLSPHPPGNYKEQHKDYCDFMSLHNNWAWNEASVTALTCLISVVLQMQWKCKCDWGKRYFPEFSLWDTSQPLRLSLVWSTLFEAFISRPSAWWQWEDSLLLHIYIYISADDCFLTDECAVKILRTLWANTSW